MADAKETEGLAARSASAPPPPGRLVGLALALYGLLFAVAAAWRLAADGTWPWRPEANLSAAWPAGIRVLAGIAMGAVLVAISRVWTSRTESGRRLAAELERLVAGVSTPQAILLAALSGIAEEAFFRGALQPRVGWLAASILFGLAHLHPRRELWGWAPSAAIAGLGFGWLFEASGDLVAPALAHTVVNAVNLRSLARRASAPLNGTPGV